MALLIYCGVLIANVYSSVVYAFTIHFGMLFLVYVGYLGLSIYLLMFGLLRLKGSEIFEKL